MHHIVTTKHFRFNLSELKSKGHYLFGFDEKEFPTLVFMKDVTSIKLVSEKVYKILTTNKFTRVVSNYKVIGDYFYCVDKNHISIKGNVSDIQNITHLHQEDKCYSDNYGMTNKTKEGSVSIIGGMSANQNITHLRQ